MRSGPFNARKPRWTQLLLWFTCLNILLLSAAYTTRLFTDRFSPTVTLDFKARTQGIGSVHPPQVNVTVTKSGDVFVGDKAIESAAVGEKLGAIFESAHCRSIYLTADSDALHRDVTRVVQLARTVGIKHIELADLQSHFIDIK